MWAVSAGRSTSCSFICSWYRYYNSYRFHICSQLTPAFLMSPDLTVMFSGQLFCSGCPWRTVLMMPDYKNGPCYISNLHRLPYPAIMLMVFHCDWLSFRSITNFVLFSLVTFIKMHICCSSVICVCGLKVFFSEFFVTFCLSRVKTSSVSLQSVLCISGITSHKSHGICRLDVFYPQGVLEIVWDFYAWALSSYFTLPNLAMMPY